MKRMIFTKRHALILGLGALSLATMQCSPNANSGDAASSDTVHLTILQTADIHGQLFVHDELFWENDEISFKKLGGFAHMKTIFNQERAANPEGTLILDGGDLIQGSAAAALSEGEVFSSVVRAMEYDFLIPGNWEVVYGKSQMLKVLNDYHTPVITANMYDSATAKPIFPQYIVKELKGVKLGFISYNDPEVPIRQNPSFSHGLNFEPIENNLIQLVDKLKDEEGVDVLFVVTHIGISKQYDLANHPELERVDYILGNDTHERIRKPLQAEHARVTEPGAFASFVGKLELKLVDGKIVEEGYDLIEVDPSIYPEDPTVAQVIDEAIAPYKEEIAEVLGYTKTPLYRYFVVENPMDNFLTDAARWKTGADISLSNGFRFSPPINLNEDGIAPITHGDLWNMLPVNENVKIGKASGQQILDWLEKELNNVFAENPTERFGGWLVRFSGMTLKFNANAPKGERVVEVMVGGEPLDVDRLYTMSACRREGEPMHVLCRMPNTVDTKVMDYTVHDMITEYLAAVDTIAPVRDGRAVALDIGDNVLSQLPGTNYHFH